MGGFHRSSYHLISKQIETSIMNSFIVIAFVAFVASINGHVIVGPSAKILQGPSSKTTLVGAEGSVISAVAPGGQIIHEEHPGVTAYAAPIVAHAAPIVAHSAPVLAYAAPAVSHASPATVVAHSSSYENENVVVAGPSGTIATGRAAHNSPVVTHAAPAVAYSAPVVAQSVPVVSHAAPVAYSASLVAQGAPVVAHALVAHDVDDNGHQGQYVHDHSELLHDDGSYKPHY